MAPYIFSIFRPDRNLPDFAGPSDDGSTFDRSTIRRGWLLVLAILLGFTLLTKVFPSQSVAPAAAPPQLGATPASR